MQLPQDDFFSVPRSMPVSFSPSIPQEILNCLKFSHGKIQTMPTQLWSIKHQVDLTDLLQSVRVNNDSCKQLSGLGGAHHQRPPDAAAIAEVEAGRMLATANEAFKVLEEMVKCIYIIQKLSICNWVRYKRLATQWCCV